VLFRSAAGLALLRMKPPSLQAARPTRFTLAPPEGGSFGYRFEGRFLAISPDGSQLVYVATDPQHGQKLWLRRLGSLEAEPLPGTEGATSVFFSPDGRSVGFFAEDKLKRLDLAVGAPVGICEVTAGGGKSGTWGRGGDILFAGVQGEAIQRVSAAGGGAPTAVIRPDPQRGESRVFWPWFLPDGERFLYIVRAGDGRRLMLAEPGRTPRAVTPMASEVQYADPGYLLFAGEGALLGQRFDSKSGRLTGAPFSIADHLRFFSSNGSAGFATSLSGTLAYQSQEDVQRLVWFDRTGKNLGTVGAPGKYLTLAIGPDGRRLLFGRAQPRSGVWDVWSFDLERDVETRITSGPESKFGAIWLPDGKSILYSTLKSGQPQIVRRQLSMEKEEEVVPAGGFQVAQDVSPDGRVLAYAERPRGSFAAFTVPLRENKPPTALLPVRLGTEVRFTLMRFSPDGRFLAFVSDESGQLEAYVTPYPGPGERTRVSTGGVYLLRWSRDGRELIYLSAERRLVSVPIHTNPSLQLGAPTILFELKGHPWIAFDVSPDGKRFLAVVPEIVANELPLTVVVNGLLEPGS
jgi:Tol biopolymer transport system component